MPREKTRRHFTFSWQAGMVNLLTWIDRTRAGAICILLCAAYAVAGLYPFNFIAGNGVHWLSPGPGVALSGHALLRTVEPVNLSAPAGTTIELYIQPADEPWRESSTLMVLYDGRFPENLVIAQWRRSVLVRTAWQDARGRRRFREMATPGLRKGSCSLVAVACSPSGVRVYVDSAAVRAYPKAFIGPEILRGDLILGTGARGITVWKGKLLGLALFKESLGPSEISEHLGLWQGNRAAELASNRAIAGLYLFNEGGGGIIREASGRGPALAIPEIYRAPAKQVLEAPWNDWAEAFSHTKDIVINVAGFVPFGFFYFFYRNLVRPDRRLAAALLSIGYSGAISLAIELLQTLLPSRSSSLSDVICNTLGGLAGVALAFAAGSPKAVDR